MQRSPFHAGERAVQTRTGVRERTESAGRRMIRDAMPDQHRELFEKLPYLIAGGSDDAGRLWATMLTGSPGFVRTPDDRTLLVAARPSALDPAAPALRRGKKLGLLGIELATRRRNRVNGLVIGEDAAGFAVHVEQSFGNCPKYIHRRRSHYRGANPRQQGPVRQEPALPSARAQEIIVGADTFFNASASPQPPGGQDHARGSTREGAR